ncbi:unnamed protein product [Microthlaspi erraticum]|uniref:non-specific serine/threonine protein kinase n=1 Tax=Microthlaspi erraticum TaxID=1685480 RepID=A0A6D2HL80_9BRAS|nr:unnamed protein product [Microthlaspi erraticum]
MSDSPASSPPAPPADSSPPPDNSTGGSAPPPSDPAPPPSPPVVSSPPPDSSPPPSPPSPPPATPPPESSPPPPLPDSSPPPPADAPPPAADPPPPPLDAGSPPPEPTNSPPPPPPEEIESPPPPPNEDQSPPAPPPPEEKSSPPESEPEQPKKSPPPPPAAPTKSPSAPTNSPPAPPNTPPRNTSSHALPPKSSTVAGGPFKSPSRGVPNVPPPPNGDGYQGKTMVGMAVAGFAIIALIAVVFLVRRKKKRNADAYSDSQYLPPSNFSIKSDGFLYGQNHSKGYSGPGGYNSQQQSGNSFGSQKGSQRGYTQSGSTPDSAVMGSGQTHFAYEELMEITDGFARQNILGEGGFGCVYKGKLHDGKLVAVKQLKVGSGQGDREFKAEVEIISRVHHRHLVSLVGYCISDVERLLIYEYVPNQTLEHHLHGKGRPVLEWARRVRIAIGSAKGLAYLHEDCHPKIIHRDIKSANILLDDEFEAQVADFGLAKLNDSTQTHVSTRVMGTFGYLAPEYAQSGKLTDRSDVFSFGVVLLELVTGRKPVDQHQPLGEESLVEWARPLLHKAIETGDFSDLVDRRLEKHYVENEVFRMIETAAACVRHSGPKRPRMVQVVRALDSEGDMGDISNGVKVGQSGAYDSGQYNSDIMKFRKMAFGFDDSSDSGMYSGDYSVPSSRKGSNGTSAEFTRNESENRFNNRRF